MMTKETKIKRRIRKMLSDIEKEGNAYWTPISQRYHSGLPDFLLVREGHTIFIEAKAPGQALRKLQSWNMRQMVKAGATYWVVTERNNKLVILENGDEVNETEIQSE